MFLGGVGPAHRELARRMADAWTAFARNGKPSADGMAEWPRYEATHRLTLRLDVDAVEVLDDPMSNERAAWDGVPV